MGEKKMKKKSISRQKKTLEKNGKEANAFFTKNKTVKEPKKLGVRKQSIKRADDFFFTRQKMKKIKFNTIRNPFKINTKTTKIHSSKQWFLTYYHMLFLSLKDLKFVISDKIITIFIYRN